MAAAALVFGSAASTAFAESNSAAADGEAEVQPFNIACASVGGKLTLSSTRAAEGTIVTITVEPDKNNVLSKLTVANNDASVYYDIIKQTDNTYTFIMPACNVTVLAQCAAAYDVTLSTEGYGTAVVSDNPAKVGAEVTVTATPEEENVVDKVTVKKADGSEVSVTNKHDGRYSFIMPNEAVDAKVSFKQIRYDINFYITNPDGGSVIMYQIGAVKSSVPVVHVTPNEGYEFDEYFVKDADGNKIELTDKKDGTYTFTMPGRNVVIYGTFKQIETSEPATSEPATSEPATSEPATSEPATSEPATSEPATSEPAASEPTASEPAASEPATSEPATSEPATSEPATSEPTASDVVPGGSEESGSGDGSDNGDENQPTGISLVVAPVLLAGGAVATAAVKKKMK